MQKLGGSTLAFNLWLALASASFAQQNLQLIDSAKKEGVVVWYGTLTGAGC